MDLYQQQVNRELQVWKRRMTRRPSIMNFLAVKTQQRINRLIPEKIHQAITVTVKQMVRGVLFGSGFVTPRVDRHLTFREREDLVRRKVQTYKHTAAVEGGLTGLGGILSGLADFPLLLGIKLKLLFDIATIYGYDVNEYSERIFILEIFQLAFSSAAHRKKVFQQVADWNEYSKTIPPDINEFDWRTFQQEYRDHIDLAKMAQLLPFVGAVVGYVVNYKLVLKLADTAMNAYRLRASQSLLIEH